MGRPWWQVRGVLWCALALVCAAPGVVAAWNDEFRDAFFAGVLRPFAEAFAPLFHADVLFALAVSTSLGLGIGWVLRRVRVPRPTGPVAQAA